MRCSLIERPVLHILQLATAQRPLGLCQGGKAAGAAQLTSTLLPMQSPLRRCPTVVGEREGCCCSKPLVFSACLKHKTCAISTGTQAASPKPRELPGPPDSAELQAVPTLCRPGLPGRTTSRVKKYLPSLAPDDEIQYHYTKGPVKFGN